VEIHDKASDWTLHRHDRDKAYDSVILHLVGFHDAAVYRTTGEAIPQALLAVPLDVRRNIDWLLHREAEIPCIHRIREIEPVHLASWTGALLSERLERKTQDIMRLLEQYNGDWNEAFYIILTRCFGFGVNNDAFERLAKSLPFRFIQKQRSSQSQVEALLFGQAGMLEEETGCHYCRLLRQEYSFFRRKFGLQPLDASLFKNLRMRPANFPHVKLAQLASVWCRYDTLFSAILEGERPEQIKALFRLLPSGYWETHYRFGETSSPKEKYLGDNALNSLLINAVVPMLFAYGRKKALPEYGDKAIGFLENIPAENNTIVSAFCRAGLSVRHAGESQALIQLKREYCEKKNCLYCRIGFRLLKRLHP
jgi:hypothetical protein